MADATTIGIIASQKSGIDDATTSRTARNSTSKKWILWLGLGVGLGFFLHWAIPASIQWIKEVTEAKPAGVTQQQSMPAPQVQTPTTPSSRIVESELGREYTTGRCSLHDRVPHVVWVC